MPSFDVPRAVRLAQSITFLATIRRTDEALKRIPELLSVAPDWHLAHLTHALVLSLKGDHDAALAAAERAIGCDPNDAHSHQAAAEQLLALERAPEAAEHIATALALAPDNARYHKTHANIARELGRRDEALTALQKAISLAPDEASYYVALVDFLDWRANPDEAHRRLREILSLDPSNAEVFFRLGQLALERREFDDAKFWLVETLRLDPTHKRADNALKGIDLTGDAVEKDDKIGEVGRAMRAAMVELYRQRLPAAERKLTLEKLGPLIAAHGLFLDELLPERVLTWERLTFAGRSFEYFTDAGVRRLGDQLVLRDYELGDLQVPEAELRYANLAFSAMNGTRFEHCNLSRAMAVNLTAHGVVFADCDLRWVDFSDSVLTDCRFERGQGDALDFERVEFQRCTFVDIAFAGASFKDARLVDCRFERCDLSTAKCTPEELASATLVDCKT